MSTEHAKKEPNTAKAATGTTTAGKEPKTENVQALIQDIENLWQWFLVLT